MLCSVLSQPLQICDDPEEVDHPPQLTLLTSCFVRGVTLDSDSWQGGTLVRLLHSRAALWDSVLVHPQRLLLYFFNVS